MHDWTASTVLSPVLAKLDGSEVLLAPLDIGLHRFFSRLPASRANLIRILLDVLDRLEDHASRI